MGDILEEYLELGREVAAKADGLRIDGRALTNIEGAALCHYRRQIAIEEMERTGCCGEGCNPDGECFRTRLRCPGWQQRRTLETLLRMMEGRSYVDNDLSAEREVAG